MSSKRDERVPSPSLPIRVIHLAVLWAFAVAQPLFDVLGRGATFFVARDSPPSDIIALAIALVTIPPMLLGLLEVLFAPLGARFGTFLHRVLIGALVFFLALPFANSWLADSTTWPISLGVFAGAVFVFAYAKFDPVRLFLTVLAPAPFIFVLLFLFGSQVRPLLSTDLPLAAKVAEIESRTPIIFVLLDEISTSSLMNAEGEIDEGLFPSFAHLSQKSTWFRNATSNIPATDFVVPIILSGRMRTAVILPIVQNYPNNLFTLFAKSHRVVAIESVTALCPDDVCEDLEPRQPLTVRTGSMVLDLGLIFARLVLPETMTRDLPPIDHRWGAFWTVPEAEGIAQIEKKHRTRIGYVRHARNIERGRTSTPFVAFERFIEAIDESDEPSLYFLHVLLPHVPWSSFPSGTLYHADDRPDGTTGKWKTWSSEEWPTRLAFQRYMLQLGATDRLLGRLFERLRENDLFDQSLIVVLGDHGVTFQPGQRYRQPSDESVRDLMHVPFFLKAPFQDLGVTDDRNVESIDILPTVADALGFRLPFKVDGTSALGPIESQRAQKRMYAGGEDWFMSGKAPEDWPGLARKLQLFGDQSRWSDIERASPRPDVIGESLASLDVRENWTGATARIEDARRFDAVDRARGLPAYVRATLRGPVPPDRIALVLNGRVWAVGDVFERRGNEARLSLLIPEAAFREGKNEVALYAIEEETLSRLELEN